MTAISQNQYIGRFHIIYSQTNLALALSLVAAINKPDNTSSDEQKTKDRQLVAQLISQSIREAKLATSLNANNVLAWENLARIYNQLIGTAQGADTWTITSYKKAIELDPKNPILRLELGSIAMKQKAYDEAIAQFKQAVMLKKNYANAYYNLANAYKVNGNTAEAIEALQQTQRYTMNGSTDYEKVSQEIEALTAK
jgi:predicted Zn-dependent protease